jgi:hypothetical protein
MPRTQHTARKTGSDASKTRSDASGRDDTAAYASKKEKLLYNLKNHVYANSSDQFMFLVKLVLLLLELYQMKQILSYSATFQKNLEVINIYQSSLVGIVVSDHVKKFITPPHNN